MGKRSGFQVFFQVWFMVPPFFRGDEVEAMISHRSALVPLSFRSVLQSEVDPLVTTGTDWGISPSKIRVLTKQNDGLNQPKYGILMILNGDG